MGSFILMHKDIKLAKLALIGNNTYISEIYSIIPEFLRNFNDWISHRASPIGRNNINILLKQAQINSHEEYLSITKAISLTDTFWVNDLDTPVTWDRINPYKNKLSRIISEIALNCSYTGGPLRSPSPEYTLDGSVDKCWKRVNGEIYLYKTDGERYTSLAGLRPYCEYYASQVAKRLGIHSYTPYGIKVKTTKNGF